jgi:hypothetical protein
MASETQKEHTLIGVTLRDGAYQMCFTEAVYFPIPMVGVPPIMAVPISPGHFIALPRKGFKKSDLEQWLAMEYSMSAFSVGLGGMAKRVIIPPGLQPRLKEESDGLKKMYRELRLNCRGIFNKIAEANAMFGLPSFTYTGDDD